MNEEKKLTPMRAIRAKCLDCMCGSAYEVRLCPSTTCPLYIYRSGHRPIPADADKGSTATLRGGLRAENENDAE